MSETVPVDVKATLFVDGVSNRPQRFWAYESVSVIAEFRHGPRGPLIDVGGVSFAFLRPDGGQPVAPEGFFHHLGVGRYLCRILPSLGGRWEVVARCEGPTAEAVAASFYVDPLPAGTPPPAVTVVTDNSGLFVLLTSDGAAMAS